MRPEDGRGIGRRTVLASAVLTVLAAALSPVRLAAGASVASDPVAALWSNPRSARRIGRAYLSQAPEEASAGRLTSALFGRHRIAAMDAAALRAHIARSRTRDFETGDTVIIGGWVLARTEARLCALAALG